ncbi:MAG TPA: HAD family hydrolase [Gemmatimonadaceae bacterium]
MSGVRIERAVLFDWDGTLVDSWHADVAATANVFRTYGVVYDQALVNRFAPNWRALYSHVGIPAHDWSAASAVYRAAYDDTKVTLKIGVPIMLGRLVRSDVRLGIVSSGARSRIERQLERFGLRPFFRVLLADGDVAFRKPDPRLLLDGISRLGVTPARTVYVGDTAADLAMGAASGVQTIHVRSAYSTMAGAGVAPLTSCRAVLRAIRSTMTS